MTTVGVSVVVCIEFRMPSHFHAACLYRSLSEAVTSNFWAFLC